MTGIIIITHGSSGSAMLEAAKGMLGPQQDAAALALLPGMGGEDLSAACQEALDGMPGPALVIVDMLGGTPWNVAASLCASHPDREVFAPLSFPALLEALSLRAQLEPRELALELKRRGVQAAAVLSELAGGASKK